LLRVGKKRSSIPLIIELSHIQAFYANQATEAITLLTEALLIPGITDMQKAELKMQLADIHVLHGDIWEASLLYMQIESELKFEPIGHEAKFKNARIFYYDGEFDFAQSQLGVLKESTSKLIANDALKLSILITDNFGLDSNYQAMTWFANGDLLIEQHRYSEAFILFDSIIATFPYHSLGDEILIRKSKAMQLQGDWTKAIIYLEELLKYYRDDILADDAIFQLGDIYENHLNDKEKASEYYKTLLFDFKGSLHSVEVRKRYRSIRGDASDEEKDDL
jgi:tetratricopeptide (TPR) repeat protein